MKRLIGWVLVMVCLACVACAEDLGAMSTEELEALRVAIGQELAARTGTDEAQVITVDGVAFRLLRVEIGEARDDAIGLGVVLLASNGSDSSMKPLTDLGTTATHGGVPLETSWVHSATFTGSSVSTSHSAVIAPGVVDMQVWLGWRLIGEGDTVELTLSTNHPQRGEDRYCGTFVIDLNAWR